MSPVAPEIPDVIVTNFNRRFTGVSSTAAQVTQQMLRRYQVRLCGHALPGCPDPIGWLEALRLSRHPGRDGLMIWHVRRNNEMQLALLARDVLRLPIRTVFTSAAQRLHSAWPRALIARMDAVIATSEGAAALVPNVRAVVPHGVDTTAFAPAPDRAAVWAASGFPGQRGIANIGRLREDKGTDTFVHAMIEVLPRHPDVTAVAFGLNQPQHRSFLARLQAEIAAAGLSERILFPGEVPAARIAALLPGFSLLVAAPRNEAFGMTVPEAMAAGVPFVATDAGIFRAASEGGRAGSIVAKGDARGLAREVDAWLSDPARLAAGALAAREIAVARYSVEREAAQVAEVYEQLWARG